MHWKVIRLDIVICIVNNAKYNVINFDITWVGFIDIVLVISRHKKISAEFSMACMKKTEEPIYCISS